LLICDVDGLKVVNDTLGHKTGDAILQAVAEMLKASFRSGDVIARIGGDEFAVIFPTDSVKALAICYHRIRERIECYNFENLLVPISVSLGYAMSNSGAVDMDALFKETDNQYVPGKTPPAKKSPQRNRTGTDESFGGTRLFNGVTWRPFAGFGSIFRRLCRFTGEQYCRSSAVRPYRKAMNKDAAIDELKHCAEHSLPQNWLRCFVD